ncbi:MAG: CNNM domain-containing protein [Verrucomicrobiales bacterium]
MGLLIFYVLLALGVSFLCSILEAVFLSITPGFIQQELGAKKGYAPKLAKMKAHVDDPLSAILTLNTIAHTMGAAGAGAQWKVIYDDTGESIFAGVLTLFVLVFSEIIPKTIGAKLWRQLAAPSTYILRVMIWALTYLPPWPLPALRLITRMFGGHGGGHGVSRAELAAMAEVSSKSGELDDEEGKILRNLFRFKSSKVEDIMTPRTVVYALRQTTPVKEFLDKTLKTPFSRIPVYEEDRDHITGFVLKSDVMAAALQDGVAEASLREFIRPLKAVDGRSSIYSTFQIMTQEKQHMLLVMDSFGGMDGVVTMEDVVETLLGTEIVDEADKNVDMQAVARALWEKRAKAMGIVVRAEKLDKLHADSSPEEGEEAQAGGSARAGEK